MITKSGAERLLGYLRSQTNLYVGLSSTCPTMDGGGIREPSAVSYKRQFVDGNSNGSSGNKNAFGDIEPTENGAKRSNTITIYFDEAYDHELQMVEDWGELKYVCLFNSASGGDLFAYQELPNPIHPGKDGESAIALIRPGDLTIEIGNPATNE